MKYLMVFLATLSFVSSVHAGHEVQKSKTAQAGKQNKQKRNVASEIAVSEENEQAYIRRISALMIESSYPVEGIDASGRETFCVGRQQPFFISAIRPDGANNTAHRSETKIRVSTVNGRVIVAACRSRANSDTIPCNVYFLNQAETVLEAYGQLSLVDVMDLSTQTERRERQNQAYCDIDHGRVRAHENNQQ